MYGPFQEHSVKKGQGVCLLIEWLGIQATLMQAIQCMVYIAKTWQNYC